MSLSHDDGLRDAASVDFGHLVHHRPSAVVRPRSAREVAEVVRSAAAAGVPVAARGRGHSGYGQALTTGIVIDMSTLATVHEVRDDRIVVDAGAGWDAVLEAAWRRGSAPPVLTDYLGLSVGGTLSAGGIGGTSFRYGLQTDTVTELEVVTGGGTVHTCVPSDDLFAAVLGGLGQCGIITRATLRLVGARERVRRREIDHATVTSAAAEQLWFIEVGRFDFVQGQVRYGASGRRIFLETATYYTTPTEPHDDGEDVPYLDFQHRLDAAEALLTQTGGWFQPHPWWNCFLPASTAVDFLESLVDALTADDLGPAGCVLFYPVFTERMHAPLVRLPPERVAYLIAILRFPPDATTAAAQLTQNLHLYREARQRGGTAYPIGAIPFTTADWHHHYGTDWPRLREWKSRYDPAQILTPGPGIFPTRDHCPPQ
ncbi:FAD-binding protein [Amycolatopsis thermophila]|uniref:FAD/FMN-containing dehydrogenase n=1 Tax=Amycolatopsis thermophila TaxID=206084 RepID=A0ABU0ELV9_9PSEU|nr:FAD-binding protein [Amycolatopsis thermophila]MDQ0376256.1 FAD/FMN-containing dehydrogenase [Amycolatopsis thermophila]